MLRTPLCDLYRIDVPIILAPMGTCTSAELAAAVSNAGGLGEIGSLFRTTAAVKRDIEFVKKLTNRHFAINHVPQTLDEEAFRLTLAARPAVISFALGDPGDLIQRAHDVGSLVMLQVTTVAQAAQAAKQQSITKAICVCLTLAESSASHSSNSGVLTASVRKNG